MALLIGRIYRLLNIVLLLCVIYKSSFKSIVKQRAAVIIVAAIYLLFFHYETNINPPLEVKGLKGLVYSTNSSTSLMYHLMFALSVSIYMQKQTMMFDKIISKFVVYSTIANAILVIVMLSKYGVEFFLVGALSYNGVTLILFSYQVMLTVVAILYAWDKVLFGKGFLLVLGLVNVGFILSMGKRGPLFAIAMVLLCFWLLRKYTLKKAMGIIALVVVGYSLFPLYVDYIIEILTAANERIGQSFAEFYYYGDLNGREILHEYANDQIATYPLWGRYPGLIMPDSTEWCFGFHPHNIWIEAVMTMGYLGSIPFFLYVGYLLFLKVIPSFSANNAYMFFAMLFVAETTHGFMSGSLASSELWLSMFVLAAYKPVKIGRANRDGK